MKNPHIIFSLTADKKLAAGVVNLPEESHFCHQYEVTGECSGNCAELHQLYKRKLDQAITNPIMFREKDVDNLRFKVWCDNLTEFQKQTCNFPIDWQPEIGKPYKFPDGLEWEIKKYCNAHGWNGACDCGNPNKQFAFLKEQSKEQNEIVSFKDCLREEFLFATEDYPREYHNLFAEKFNRALKRFEQQENPKGQDELWIDAIDTLLEKGKEELKSKFTIQRK